MNFSEYQSTDLPKRLAKELQDPFWIATFAALRSMNDVNLNLDLPIGVITSNGTALGAIAIGQEKVFRNLAVLAGNDVPATELPFTLTVPPELATE